MKTRLTNYKDGEIHSSKVYGTKKEAQLQKKTFLRMWTVKEKVMHNIQSIISY